MGCASIDSDGCWSFSMDHWVLELLRCVNVQYFDLLSRYSLFQVSANHPCLGTLKRRDIGWS